jgi:hypothetical protein
MNLARLPNRTNCVVAISPNGNVAHYQYGSENEQWKGFGGQPWHIKFTDERELVTTNLWSQGDIPTVLLEYFPINAVLTQLDHNGKPFAKTNSVLQA